MQYGRLTVIARSDDFIYPNGKHRVSWLCRCECGNEVSVMSCNLRTGNTKSCGCLNDENIKAMSITHGGRHTRLYSIWTNIKTRCYNKSAPIYKRYGGRGIVMCEDWKSSFQKFREWSLQNGYEDGSSSNRSDAMTIDRIDVNGDYCPSNCRWVYPKEQANNRRNTVRITANGETHTISEWSDITGVKYATIFARLYKLHWSPEDAVGISISNQQI